MFFDAGGLNPKATCTDVRSCCRDSFVTKDVAVFVLTAKTAVRPMAICSRSAMDGVLIFSVSSRTGAGVTFA